MRITISVPLFLLSACQLATLPVASTSSTTPSSSSSPSPSPTQPEAGKPRHPGGELDDRSATCDAAHDHCLRGPWFAVDADGWNVRPVYEADGRWWSWQDDLEVTTGPILETRAAAPDEVVPGARVVFRQGVPHHEREAAAFFWRVGTVYEVADGSFEIDQGSVGFSLETVRLVVGER